MPFKIQYYPEVFNDLEKLTDDEFLEVDAYIEKLKVNPLLVSLSLDNIGDNLLSECCKIYVANATIRIVIRVINSQIHIVELIAIGSRSAGVVYDEAYRRFTPRAFPPLVRAVDSGIGLK